jgi:GntR family transcriptional regulator
MSHTEGEHSADSGAADRLIAAIRDVVDAERGTPRYERIAEEIERQIDAGALPPGTLLPQEPELAAALGTSRQTLRRSYDRLARRGLIVRRRGIGTFVRKPDVEQPLGRLSSFLQTLALSGEPPAVQLIGARRALDRTASRLFTGDDAQLVFEITRLFSVGGEPIVLETIFLPVELADQLPIESLANAVIDRLLLDRAGIRVDRGEESLRMTHVDRMEAALLAIRAREPAFLIERIAYSGDRVVELRRSIVRGDRARFSIALQDAQMAPDSASTMLVPD